MSRIEKLQIKRADGLQRDKPPSSTSGTVSSDAVLEKMNPNDVNGIYYANAKPNSPIPSTPKGGREPK